MQKQKIPHNNSRMIINAECFTFTPKQPKMIIHAAASKKYDKKITHKNSIMATNLIKISISKKKISSKIFNLLKSWNFA